MHESGTQTLEVRVTKLEQEMREVKRRIALKPIIESEIPWWDRIFGTFANSEEFLSAMRAGREYRESSRDPRDGDTEDQTT
ncbi:MAG: hypothetical protein H8F28_09020 [Fibrella sp.]|nr:hypothetical protein [Armatimonadota bacterium]